MKTTPVRDQILSLSHELGRESRGLAILGEGNTSARVSAETFLVKASGSNLASLDENGITLCRFDVLLALLKRSKISDQEVDDALLASRVNSTDRKPSVEAMFHAYLLTLPGVDFVGHTHPITVNSILCTEHARTFATRRVCPDEIVCCGPESVLVPYTDPGLKLAQAIQKAVKAYVQRQSRAPRVILLQSHGLIALGAKPEAVLAASLMGEKAAKVFVGAQSIGRPRFLSAASVARIAGRPDEHYRQKVLGL